MRTREADKTGSSNMTKIARRWAILPLLAMLLAVSAGAGKPGRWEFDDRASYAKSRIDGLEVTHDGRLKPGVSHIGRGIPADYIWSIAEFGDDVFLGTGDGARIFHVSGADFAAYQRNDTTGITVAWEGDGLEVYAMAAPDASTLVAGISPLGRIMFFDRTGGELAARDTVVLADSYVWRILPVGDDLWIATGSSDVNAGGAIYRYRDGELQLVYRSTDGHVLAVAESGGRIYAGTEGVGGVVIAIDNIRGRKPDASIIFDPAEAEILDIVAGEEGAVYVLTSGGTASRPMILPNVPEVEGEEGGENGEPMPPVAPRAVGGKSYSATIYRIDKSGKAEEWILAASRVRTAFRGPYGLLVGTAAQGNVYRVDQRMKSTLLLGLDEKNVLTLSRNYIGAGHPATLYKMKPSTEGAYWRSEPLDADGRTTWGVVTFESQGDWEVRTRSGNSKEPNESWSGWSLPIRATGGRIESPSARYLQFEATSPRPEAQDFIARLAISYQILNRAPRVNSVNVRKVSFDESAVGKLRRGGPLGQIVSQLFQSTKNLPKEKNGGADGPIIEDFLQPFAGLWQVEWEAEDPDGAMLSARIEVVDEVTGKAVVVAADFDGNLYLLNTKNFPDGDYRVRVTVTDEADGSIGGAMEASDQTVDFRIDNSTPAVELRSAKQSSGEVLVEGIARDELGYVAALYYFDDEGQWESFLPDDGISDQPEESFRFVRISKPEKQSLIVKAVDQNGNVGFARIYY